MSGFEGLYMNEELDFSDFDESILNEQVTDILKPGTRFERDVRMINNQTTFKQYLDRSGVSETVRTLIYSQISRIRPIADAFPNKTWIWKALYIGAVYQALSDHELMTNIIK